MHPSLRPVSYWWNTTVTALSSSSVSGARNTLRRTGLVSPSIVSAAAVTNARY